MGKLTDKDLSELHRRQHYRTPNPGLVILTGNIEHFRNPPEPEFDRFQCRDDMGTLLEAYEALKKEYSEYQWRHPVNDYALKRANETIESLSKCERLWAAEVVCDALYEVWIPKALVGGRGMQDPIEWSEIPESVIEDVTEGLLYWENVKRKAPVRISP